MKASDWHRAGPKPSPVFARRTAPGTFALQTSHHRAIGVQLHTVKPVPSSRRRDLSIWEGFLLVAFGAERIFS